MGRELTRASFDNLPEIDFSIGLRYFLSNLDNYTKSLWAILKSIKSKLPILQSMNLNNEYEGLRTITQTLRKMLGNIGAIELSNETYDLELALLNDNYNYLEEHLNIYIARLVELSEQLEVLLKNSDYKNTSKTKEPNSFLNYDFTKTKESIKRTTDLLERKII